MNTTHKPTSGIWQVHTNDYDERISQYQVLDFEGRLSICDMNDQDYPFGIAKANAELIAEAGTVYHQFGLTPMQLLEQRNELINTLNYCLFGLPVDSEIKEGEPKANVHKIQKTILKQLKKFHNDNTK